MVQECLNCIELRKRIKELETKIISIDGWKGKDKISFEMGDDEWIVVEHRKEKSSGDIAENKHIIPHSDVTFLLKLFKEFFDDGKTLLRAKQDVWFNLIQAKKLNVELDAFNGGKYRAKFYFRYYYYPAKILEHLGYIDYSGSGIITLIEKKFKGDLNG
jgi:hypothetical protein